MNPELLSWFNGSKITDNNGNPLLVYRGINKSSNVSTNIRFFSSSKQFARDYGDVKGFYLLINRPFNTHNRRDVVKLMKVCQLRDKYLEETDGEPHPLNSFDDYASYEIFNNSWEVFEEHVDKIKMLGYDGMIIWEGGIKNFATFEDNQYKEYKEANMDSNIGQTAENFEIHTMPNIKTAASNAKVKEEDYPSVDEISTYAESLKLYLFEGKIKDKEIRNLVENLPDPSTIRKRFSNEEAKILFQTIGYVWKKVTGRNIVKDSKIEKKPETLMGNYWLIQKGILLEGVNHYSIIKNNLELFRILLGIHAFTLHEKMASPPDELIKLVLDHGGVRIFVSKDRRAYFQLTDKTYGKWGSRKIREYDFNNKVVKVIDSNAPYKGWNSGILIRGL